MPTKHWVSSRPVLVLHSLDVVLTGRTLKGGCRGDDVLGQGPAEFCLHKSLNVSVALPATYGHV